MSKDRLIYLPLGGAGEIGMNCYVYGYGKPGKERLIVADVGVTFPDMDGAPGVDLILPDVAFLRDNRDRVEAIFITHAHEDHVGALAHHFEDLGAPVYARAFTGLIAQMKLEEKGVGPEAVTITEPWPATVKAGPFTVGFQPISHSIPESSALVIDSPAGRVVHTGDFKLDETPLVGEPFDSAAFSKLAKDGVHALVCDSTNVFSPNPGRSESTIGTEIEALISNAPRRVIATTFASNVARVRTLAEAGTRAGRSICLLGRAMRRMVDASVKSGVLTDFPPTVAPEDAEHLPRENLMLIVTGSQGERRAASAQLSRGKYLGIELEEGDLFLFSSKTIPGNENSVARIMNNFSERGVDVVDDETGKYHVSGHANRPDLEAMHKLIKPTMLVPMHGEHRHLRAHSKLAAQGGMTSVIAPNGTMVDLTGDAPKVVEHIDAGRIYLDGDVKIGAMDGVIRDRLRLARNGHVVVTLIVEDGEVLGEPWCDTMGLPQTGTSRAALVEVLEEDLSQFLGRAKRKTLQDDDKLEDELRKVVRSTTDNEIGKKPEVTVIVSRLS
jgi:ribonuclease J